MFSYYLKCRKSTKSKNRKIVETKTRRVMLLSKCSMCNSEKLKFLKEQGVKGWLSSLGKKNNFKSNSFVRPSFVLKA